MEKQTLTALLAKYAYPGRGIMLGKTQNGKHAVIVYFIMGRSENSRNRVFTKKESGIVTEAANPAKLQDPSLVIYAPVRKLGNYTIVTNGDQTDTIYNSLQNNKTFEDALRTRTFEPDEPLYTPRISGLVQIENNKANFTLSILKSSEGNPNSPLRYFYEYTEPLAGIGRFIHTYESGENILPSFSGEPHCIAVDNEDIKTFTSSVWNAMHSENKISLFVRYINIENGEEHTQIINKYEKQS